MVHRVSLKDVLRTGEFGNVRFGLSEPEILALLGPPDDVGTTTRKRKRPLLWKYGEVEFHFDFQTPNLIGIAINFWEERSIPSGGTVIELDPWIIQGGLEWSELRPWLDAEAIDYRVADPINLDTTEIAVGPTALLIFNDDKEEFLGLRKISLFCKDS